MAFVGMRQPAVRRRWILSGFIEVHTGVYGLARLQEHLGEQPTPRRTFVLQQIRPGQFKPGSYIKTLPTTPSPDAPDLILKAPKCSPQHALQR